MAILDADKEGFLRSETSLIQTIGRAARNSEGHVVMYADTMTDSMRLAIQETERRRAVQMAYNEEDVYKRQDFRFLYMNGSACIGLIRPARPESFWDGKRSPG